MRDHDRQAARSRQAVAREKDALIRDLWRQVAAGQSEARLLKRPARHGAAGGADGARARCSTKLREAAPRRPSNRRRAISVKLGRGLGLWRSPVVVGIVAIILCGLRHRWRHRHLSGSAPCSSSARRACCSSTRRCNSLYVELKRIVLEPDGKSYRMTLAMQNIDPAAPLYVMLNAVGVYVQSGMTWQQVPSQPAPRRRAGASSSSSTPIPTTCCSRPRWRTGPS